MQASAAERVRISNGADSLIPHLATGLGHFAQEGLDVRSVRVTNMAPVDWRSTELLNSGQLDAELHWFQRIFFGVGNNAPAQAVVLIEDTPGITIMVANRARSEIRSAADFKGRRVAEGAGYSTKSYLTRYMAQKAGLPPDSYTPVAVDSDGRLEAIVEGLKEGRVDVVVSMEPMTSQVLATGMVTTLYDLTTKEGTRKALGDVWPARCVYVAPSYMKSHPETVQRLVNAFVRTMRYVNSHGAEEIASRLPPAYFKGKDRQAEIDRIRRMMPLFAKGDYSIPPSAARLMRQVLSLSSFDQSDEGRYRTAAMKAEVRPEQTYANQFVERAMKKIP
jgi:NitT/TauT family transport system substrate-binding protein